MKRWMIASLVLTVAVFVGFSAAGDVEEGKALYAKKCATCHGKSGEGNPAMAKMLKVELKDLSSTEVQAHSDAELKKIVVEGSGKMKPVKGLSDDDVADVVAFTRSLAKK